MAGIAFLPWFMTFPAMSSWLDLQYRNEFFSINLSLSTVRHLLVISHTSVPPLNLGGILPRWSLLCSVYNLEGLLITSSLAACITLLMLGKLVLRKEASRSAPARSLQFCDGRMWCLQQQGPTFKLWLATKNNSLYCWEGLSWAAWLTTQREVSILGN